MSRFGYSKRHLYKDAVRRRLFLLRRALARGGTTIDKRATASVYWVGDADSDWYNSANWASSTGGVGGAGTGGIPTAATTVTFTGEHSNGCVLGAPVSCGAFVFDTSQGTPVDGFDMAGHTLNCTTFAYNTSDDITVILDGEIRLTGATFTVVAMHATAEAAWTGTIVLEENCTFASTPGVPATTAEKNFTTTAAVGMARLTGGGS